MRRLFLKLKALLQRKEARSWGKNGARSGTCFLTKTGRPLLNKGGTKHVLTKKVHPLYFAQRQSRVKIYRNYAMTSLRSVLVTDIKLLTMSP
jgi:hypothetical protein